MLGAPPMRKKHILPTTHVGVPVGSFVQHIAQRGQVGSGGPPNCREETDVRLSYYRSP